MPLTLLVTGLVMNVVGVAIGSSADLSHLFASGLDRVAQAIRKTDRRLALWWRRVVLRRQGLEVHDASSSVTASAVVLAQGYPWAGVQESDSTAEVLQALTRRTDALRDLVERERQDRTSSLKDIAVELQGIQSSVAEIVVELRGRIDDFTVKSAGRRGFGAFLVIVGSLLMFAGGMLAK